MTVSDLLRKFIEDRGLQGLEKLKAQAAIRSLDQVVGHMDARLLVLEPEFGQVIQVPGDDAPWLVYGTYLDGTVDIIRDQAMGVKDRLVGYKIGDSIPQYLTELEKEELPDVPPAKSLKFPKRK